MNLVSYLYERQWFALIVILTFLALFSGRLQAAEESRITLLEFAASSCQACQEAEPLVQEMIHKGYPVQKVNMDDQATHPMFQQYRVTAMPTFILLVDGQEMERTVGIGGGRNALGEELLRMFNRAISMTQTPSVPQMEPGPNPITQNSTMPEPMGTNEIRPVSAVLPVPPVHEPDLNALAEKTAPYHQDNHGSVAGAEDFLKSVSVRLRVYNNNTVDRGTGTIIHVNRLQGTREALVLTCGHLFRPNQGRGQVEVDLYEPTTGQMTTVLGQCLAFDDEIDVGFVGIPLPFELTPATIARANDEVMPGDTAVSIGCSGGDDPTLLEHQILTTREKFFRPRDPATGKKEFCYLEVSNAPVGGRSGGGLFALGPDGYRLIGVCNAGDTTTNEGYFVPVPIIYEQLLSKESLRFVYNDLTGKDSASRDLSGSREQATGLAASNAAVSNAAVSPLAMTTGSPQSAPMEPVYGGIPAVRGMESDHRLLTATSDDALSATLDEIRRRQAEGAEIICIVHWKNDARGADGSARETEVIRLPNSQTANGN